MERRYRLLPSPDLLQVDYDQLADDNLDSTRYSVDKQWAIIEYKITATGTFVLWTNDEACEYLEAHFDEWNEPSLP